MAEDNNARAAVESADRPQQPSKNDPAAGPHAKPELTDNEKTPGAGALPSEGSPEIDAGSE